ncbi:hypothetical protein G155_27970 [Mycobacterium sp. VKM Ac-1817D]|nr:hypothetical protein G155_27970 [Mycobacterium sp. VKM Ac-1817D]
MDNAGYRNDSLDQTLQVGLGCRRNPDEQVIPPGRRVNFEDGRDSSELIDDRGQSALLNLDRDECLNRKAGLFEV